MTYSACVRLCGPKRLRCRTRAYMYPYIYIYIYEPIKKKSTFHRSNKQTLDFVKAAIIFLNLMNRYHSRMHSQYAGVYAASTPNMLVYMHPAAHVSTGTCALMHAHICEQR